MEKIKRCVCLQKDGDEYQLICKIHQRGEGQYLYLPGTACLKRSHTDKGLYLSESAQQTVDRAAAIFDDETSEEVMLYYMKAEICEGRAAIWFRRLSRYRFSAVLTYKDAEGSPSRQ